MNNLYANDFTDTTKTYLEELDFDKYEPIPKEVEDDLIKKIRNNDTHARNQLIEAHLRLVVNIAKKYKGKGAEISDLIQEGNLGLFTAIDRFDETKNVRFCAYAVWWITKSIIDVLKNSKKLRDNEMKFSEIEIETDSTETENTIFSEKSDSPSNPMVIANEDENKQYYQEAVISLLSVLDERSKYIIEHYYGLNDKDYLSINDISKELNITTERVRQLKAKAMMALRSYALIENVSLGC